MTKPNEEYPAARPVGEDPATGHEKSRIYKPEGRRLLGRLSLRRHQEQRDPHTEARERREAEIDRLHGLIREQQSGELFGLGFLADGSVYSYTKWLPRRPRHEGEDGFTGSYDDLAEATLQLALAEREDDQSVRLIGMQRVNHRLQDLESGNETTRPLTVEEATASVLEDMRYSKGASVLLWKLGLLEYEKEEDIPYARGEFAEDAVWDREYYGKSATITLPFDAENALHTELAAGLGVQNPGTIEFMVDPKTGLSLRLNEAIAEAAAA